MIVNQVLPCFSSTRVPRPTICLNSPMAPISWSITMSLQSLASTPVVRSFEVVAMTG